MSQPQPTLQELTADQCCQLLETQQIGRLGVNAQHYPLIFPVNYAVEVGVIVIRSNPVLKLSAADHANVAFEVDQVDTVRRAGWSVLSAASPRSAPRSTARR